MPTKSRCDLLKVTLTGRNLRNSCTTPPNISLLNVPLPNASGTNLINEVTRIVPTYNFTSKISEENPSLHGDGSIGFVNNRRIVEKINGMLRGSPVIF